MVLEVGNVFSLAEKMRDAIQRHVLDQGELYKVTRSDKTRYIMVCKDKQCSFRIRASNIAKKGWTITKIDTYLYSPTIHYKNKQSHSVKYLIEHHHASIINNRHITTAQIRSNERLNYSYKISYL
jgi:hypothetical protein